VTRWRHFDAAQLSLLVAIASASDFDPHSLPATGPYFEGWFSRVTDHMVNRSAALIFGVFQPAGRTAPTQVWAAVLVQGAGIPGGGTVTRQVLRDATARLNISRHGHPVTHEPVPTAPVSFEFRSPSLTLLADGDRVSFDATIDGLTLRATTTHRLPWSSAKPDGPGPEGWLARLHALLPCHYYVQSLGSDAEYEIRGSAVEGGSLYGRGVAHLEANYGRSFPDAWIWSQSVRGSREGGARDGAREGGEAEAALLLAHMEIGLGPLRINQSIVTLRVKDADGGLELTFRQADLDYIHLESEACAGSLRLHASSPTLPAVPPARELHATISAPPSTFSEPLYFPTTTGFSNRPGCVESYAAIASVRAYAHGTLLRTVQIELGALEFGGRWRCHN